MRHFDVLIVGNGILAYSSAFALMLENASLRIAILGPSTRLGGATSAAGAMLGCFGEITKTAISTTYGQAKFKLGMKAASLWPDWLAQMNEYIDLRYHESIRPGTFVILNAKSGIIDDENYLAIRNTLNEYNQPYEDIDPRTVPGLDPIEDCRPLRAMYLPNEGSIKSIQVLANLQTIAEQSPSISIIDDFAKTIRVLASQVLQIETATGNKISANHVLIAAGVGSQPLIEQLPELAYRIPRIFAGVGRSIVVEQFVPPCTAVIRTPNRSFACGLHVLPRDDHHLYIGATNNVEFLPSFRPNVTDIHFLLECAMEQIHQGLQGSELVAWNTGNRPVTIDTYPLIGRTSIAGLWILTGTYREGFHLSPLLAQHIAKQILGAGALFEDLFPPERLPIRNLSKQQAIEETVKHYMAVGFEFSIKIPQVGWQDMLRGMLFDKVDSLYNELDSDYVLPPDFVSMIDVDRQKFIPYFRNYYQNLPQ